MTNYKIITDSGCDLPRKMLKELNVNRVSLSVLFRGRTQEDTVDEGVRELYDALRQGEVATTAAVNPEGWTGVIEPVLQEGQDALVLAFSSGLSATCQSATIAARESWRCFSWEKTAKQP